MTTTTWDALKKRQDALIRKALDGSVFLAPVSATAVTALTSGAGASLQTLPTGYTDLGHITADGVTYATSENVDEQTSWGEIEPTRSDIISRSTTLACVCQETNIKTLQLYTGNDLSAVAPPLSGEVIIDESPRPLPVYYRVLTVSVDESDAGEIYIARFLPRAKVTAQDNQKQSASGETQFGFTFTAYKDDTLGFAVRHLFGGPGWKAQLVSAGFPAAALS